jgi:Flp pilus assembly pilin Flp
MFRKLGDHPQPGIARTGHNGGKRRLLVARDAVQWLRRLAHDAGGAALVEFTIVAMLLITLLVGIVQFGLLLNGYIVLTNATEAGARRLALSRGTDRPYTDTQSQIYASAANMTAASLTISVAVNGAGCTTDFRLQDGIDERAGPPGDRGDDLSVQPVDHHLRILHREQLHVGLEHHGARGVRRLQEEGSAWHEMRSHVPARPVASRPCRQCNDPDGTIDERAARDRRPRRRCRARALRQEQGPGGG